VQTCEDYVKAKQLQITTDLLRHAVNDINNWYVKDQGGQSFVSDHIKFTNSIILGNVPGSPEMFMFSEMSSRTKPLNSANTTGPLSTTNRGSALS